MAVEFPNITFESAGKNYEFVANLYNNDNNFSISLNTSGVECFELVNELNKLYLTGSMIYIDEVGKLINNINAQNLFLDVLFAELQTTTNNNESISVRSKEKNKIIHQQFIVSNIEILNRHLETITYKLHLVGINYLILSCPIEYSNYNDKKLPIVQIIKNCLINNDQKKDLITVGKSFDENLDNIKIYYIAKENDTAITSIDYLLNRLFYLNETDKSLKFIYYNNLSFYDPNSKEIEKQINYEIMDLNDYYEKSLDNLDIAYKHDIIILSMYKTDEESILYKKENNIGSVVKFPKTLTYNNLFDKKIIEYDIKQNLISSNILSSNTITEFANYRGSSFQEKNKDRFIPFKFEDNKLIKLNLTPKMQFAYPTWNNNFNTYYDVVNELFNDNALIINTVGKITRIPSGIIQINVPLSPDAHNQNKSIDKYLQEKYTYAQLEGLWITSKVRHIISPAKGLYTQNLILFKNYIEKQLDTDQI